MKKILITVILITSALVFSGCSLPWQRRVVALSTPQEEKVAQVIMKVTTKEGKTYDYTIDLKEGLTAFDLFKYAGVPVEVKQYGFGVYVQSVGEIKEGSGLFWIYYVNGQPAMQAADKYQVKKGDVIEWKLEKEKEGL